MTPPPTRLLVEERRRKILDLVNRQARVTVDELVKRFTASVPFDQYVTPRFGPRDGIPESKRHASLPVAASSATTRWPGVFA